MGKRKNQQLIDTDSESESDNSLESDLLALAKKKKGGKRLASTSPRKSSDSSGSDSEEDTKKAKKSRMTHSDDSSDNEEENVVASQESGKSKEDEKEKSDLEEGQISSDEEDEESSESESSSESEFSDGYDENLMGDEEDRARLEALTEKEREQEIFKRIEERERMKTRWEIERKLKIARREKDKSSGIKKPKKKKEKNKKMESKKKPAEKSAKFTSSQQSSSYSIPQNASNSSASNSQMYSSQVDTDTGNNSDQFKEDYFDPKERSKERKKNVEANRTDDKRSNAMALLKAKREGKQKREEEEAKREAQKKIEDEKEELDGMTGSKSSVKLKASDVYSDDSSSESEEKPSDIDRRSSSRSSSDSEEDTKSQKSDSGKKPTNITTKEELNQLRISRHKLEKFIHLPVFEKTVVGCFVRINIGNNNMSGKLVYRAAEIVAVVETPKVYQFGSSRTNKGLRLKHGTQERIFRLEFVSNSDFTDSEFEKWRSMCMQYDVELPTIERISSKQKDIQLALSYEFKEEDIDRIVEEKNRFRTHPTNYAMKKTTLMKERDAAILRGEHDLAKEINFQIQELEQRANELDKKRTSTISSISYINNRNRKKNVEEAEKAIMEEMKASRGVKYSDPFTRRSTKPTMAFKAASNDEPIIMAPEPPKIHHKQKESTKEEHNSADVYSLHDFDIDLDVPLPMNNVQVLPKPVEKPQPTGPKRSLNLEDYKKKRGLI